MTKKQKSEAKEKLLSKLEEMTEAERSLLVEEICRICEKQYRKGYQQGSFHTRKGLVTEKQVDDFRYNGISQGYSKVVYPPFFEQQANPVLIVSGELAMQDMELLQYLFR